jgi:hypothetical protein
MPLPPEVEQLLQFVESEEDRGTLRAALEKQDKLVAELKENRNSGLRQSDYDRNMNKLKETATKLSEWRDEVDKEYQKALQERKTAVEEVNRLNKELEAIQTTKSTTDTLDEGLWDVDNKALKKTLDDYQKSVLDKIEQLNSKIASLDPTRFLTTQQMNDYFAQEAQKYTHNIGGSILESIKLNDIADEHMRTFGSPLKRTELVDFAIKHDLPVEQAYEAMTKAAREEAYRKKVREEVTKEIESKREYPLSPQVSQERSYLQSRAQGPESGNWSKTITDVSPEQLASAAADALFKEGKF